MHDALIEALTRQPPFADTLEALPAPGGTLGVGGLPGSGPMLLAAALTRALPGRLWVVVAHSPAGAEAAEADLQVLLGPEAAALYPQRETLPYEAAEHHVEVSGLRVEALEALLAGRVRVLVTTLRALQELAEIPSGLAELRLRIAVGQEVRPAALAERLEAMGFERAPMVEGVGEYALRGGIVDLFGFGAPEPVRLEFWGDEVVSIRHFDVLNQRSTGELPDIDVLPVDLRAAAEADETVPTRRSLLDVISRDAVLLELDAGREEEEFRHTWEQVVHLHEAAHRRGAAPEPPHALFLPAAAAMARLRALGRIRMVAGPQAEVRFDAREPEAIERDMDTLAALLRTGAARGEETWILCDNAGQLERLEELIGDREHRLPDGTRLALGALAAGLVLEGTEPPVRILTDHEIFRRERRLRRGRRFRGAVALESLAQLRPGDFVVHMDHGVGRFLGLEHVRVLDEEIEALAIEYANGEKLRVPVYRVDLIERWVSDREGADTPRLHKIGGRTWKGLKRRTEASIREMATKLLELYARRNLAERPPLPPDTRWQKEMESSFLYEDTPDQRAATADVKRDLERPRPMDRLLCGDVGYGKTEVAIRAAFKAVQDGRQVAVLAPTTILVEQHLHTFRDRLAGYPVRIEALSRFHGGREQADVLASVAAGQVDILIGTHRILSGDIVFKRLGLLVVDEEQRFGVKQKERFAELKTDVDVLSLTATPIPRTLHLSLTGLRDLSLLQTPPRDRMPVITHVIPWVDEVLEDAMRRELDRGGQVFVVHNRIQSIGAVAERVRRLVPETRAVVAHGQMPAHELDEVMRTFLDRKAQVLVTTAIIENGLDVPTANTLIVDRADMFGLAQLYQIRGRVGRSHHRAYCYLVTPPDVTDEAEKRLRILEHFTELGSGYAVALKDLELRGAGNILGAEQSGFVHAVGLDTYTRLLEETIKRLQAGEREELVPTDVSLEGAAFLPDAYVAESSQKLHLYRRLSRVEDAAGVKALREEVRDRYGAPPAEVDRLFGGASLRVLGTRLDVERVLVRGDSARVTFRPGASPRLAVLQGALHDRQVEVEVKRTAPLSIVVRRRGAHELVPTLVAAFELLLEERARAA